MKVIEKIIENVSKEIEFSDPNLNGSFKIVKHYHFGLRCASIFDWFFTSNIVNFTLYILKVLWDKSYQFAVKLICKRAFNRLESVHVKWLLDKDQFLLVHLTRSLTGKRTRVIANFLVFNTKNLSATPHLALCKTNLPSSGLSTSFKMCMTNFEFRFKRFQTYYAMLG